VIELTDDPPENNCRPAVDYLFRSAANRFPGRAMAVILTGMGSDGTLGLRLLKRHGCFVIAQDEASCVVYGMPKAAVDAGCGGCRPALEFHRQPDRCRRQGRPGLSIAITREEMPSGPATSTRSAAFIWTTPRDIWWRRAWQPALRGRRLQFLRALPQGAPTRPANSAAKSLKPSPPTKPPSFAIPRPLICCGTSLFPNSSTGATERRTDTHPHLERRLFYRPGGV
jgi:hypothetical protein